MKDQEPPHNNVLENDLIQMETEKLDKFNKKQENKVKNLETKPIQLMNLYFIFQAVILLTSTTTTSSIKCHNWWIPFALSLMGALVNAIAFIDAMSKVLKARDELDQNRADLSFMMVHRLTKAQVNQVLPGELLMNQVVGIFRPTADSSRMWKRRLLAYLCFGFFIGFSGVVMYGCYAALCHSNHNKCIKVC